MLQMDSAPSGTNVYSSMQPGIAIAGRHLSCVPGSSRVCKNKEAIVFQLTTH